MAVNGKSRSFQSKPDFDECMGRISAWYDQRILDRPPILDPPLQGSQLPVLILARLSPLEREIRSMRFCVRLGTMCGNYFPLFCAQCVDGYIICAIREIDWIPSCG